jgi:hypothetical protein
MGFIGTGLRREGEGEVPFTRVVWRSRRAIARRLHQATKTVASNSLSAGWL